LASDTVGVRDMLMAILVIGRHDVEAKSERKSWTAGGEGVT
jgi:hypothetical protein